MHLSIKIKPAEIVSMELIVRLQAQVTMKVINGLYPDVTTVELDNLAAEICASNATKHPDFAILAARIAVSNIHKETQKVFSGKCRWERIEANNCI